MDDWEGWTLTQTGVTPEPGMLCRLRLRIRGGAMIPDDSIKVLTARYDVSGWQCGGGAVLDTGESSGVEVLAWQPVERPRREPNPLFASAPTVLNPTYSGGRR